MRGRAQSEFRRIIIREPGLALKVSLPFPEGLYPFFQPGILRSFSKRSLRLPQENPDFQVLFFQGLPLPAQKLAFAAVLGSVVKPCTHIFVNEIMRPSCTLCLKWKPVY